MQSQTIELRNTNYYLIINKYTGRCLHLPSNSKNFEKEKLLLAEPSQSDLSQIWMLVEVAPDRYPGKFQIVHTLSTLVLTSEKDQMKLSFGSWKGNQLFFPQRPDPKNYPNYFWFKQDRDSQRYLTCTEKGCQMVETNSPDDGSVWELVLVHQNTVINRSCYIEYAYSNQVLDVPKASDKSGVAICQYPINNRFNQRWNLIKTGQYYLIENLKTGKVLDIKGESKKPGANIIQWQSTGSLNQKWVIEYQGKNIYLIRSAMDPDLFLSVKDNSLRDCADVVTTKSDDDCFWRIVGFIP